MEKWSLIFIIICDCNKINNKVHIYNGFSKLLNRVNKTLSEDSTNLGAWEHQLLSPGLPSPWPPSSHLQSSSWLLGPPALLGISPRLSIQVLFTFSFPHFAPAHAELAVKPDGITRSGSAHRFCWAAQYTSEENFLVLKPSIYRRLCSSLQGQLCNLSVFNPAILPLGIHPPELKAPI